MRDSSSGREFRFRPAGSASAFLTTGSHYYDPRATRQPPEAVDLNGAQRELPKHLDLTNRVAALAGSAGVSLAPGPF